VTTEKGTQKLTHYLLDARSIELALVRTLQAHIAMTPSGQYRRSLERHLRETRDHAKRVERRAKELGYGRSPLELGRGVIQGVLSQALALTKGPLDLVRGGPRGEEKLLRNARDEAASEALEIATYDAIEEFARELGDDVTAELAVSIRGDEERMLEELREVIPELVGDVVKAELQGVETYDISKTGAARDARRAQSAAKRTARDATTGAKRAARQARKVPGVARIEGELKGAVASAEDLPISGYDELSAEEIVRRLPQLSQIDLSKIDAYERRNQARKRVLERIESLRSEEPWPGYDEMTGEDIRKALNAADDETAAKIAQYERRHKQRQTVLEAAEQLAGKH
jgi:ferritin-like metal-binding protein YciE